MRIPRVNTIIALVVGSTALTGLISRFTGKPPVEGPLNHYAAAQIDRSLKDQSWQARVDEGLTIHAKQLELSDNDRSKSEPVAYAREVDQTVEYFQHHYDPLVKSAQAYTDKLRAQFGIEPEIKVELIHNSYAGTAASVEYGAQHITMGITSAELDLLTQRELEETLRREVAGRVKQHFVDTNGKLLPTDQILVNSKTAFSHTSCDVDAATSAFLKEEANHQGQTLSDLRQKLAKGSQAQNHDWLARIGEMKLEAEKACHSARG